MEMNKNNLWNSFVKEVAKYFMDFLETDFKKRRIPKRNTLQKTQCGLKTGIDLEKYLKLKKVVFNILNTDFKKDCLIIKKGEYINNIPSALINLIVNKIEQLSEKDLFDFFSEVEEIVEEKITIFIKEYDKFLEESKEEIKNSFWKSIIIPFLKDLDKPLDNLDLVNENSKYQLEIDVIDSIFSIFEEKLLDILQFYFQTKQLKENFDFKNTIKGIIIIDEIKENLISFFKNVSIGDAFDDIYLLYRSNKLIDKTEIYLYLFEISIDKDYFPIFYIPVSLEEQDNSFKLKFDSRLFLNTKAIYFVAEQFNLQNNKTISLSGEFERIIYLNEEINVFQKIQSIIKFLVNFFEFNSDIIFQNFEFQKLKNLSSSLSNKCNLYLFDKSDEALINDYEEILNDKGELIEVFSNVLNGFVENDPVSYIKEVRNEWFNKTTSQKLIFESPIPLNDEQKKVLIALQKKDCKIMVLEWPPGTGKSHTITAIICKALLEEKSVLVLSDKKEALDVVEGKISETLNKVRHESDFQNPILRLGKMGNKFYKIVQGQTIQKIKDYYLAYKSQKENFNSIKDTAFKELEINIIDNIKHFEQIEISDIKSYFNSLKRFSKIKWIESENLCEIKDDFLNIKNVIKKLHKFTLCDFKIDFVNDKTFFTLKNIEKQLLRLEEIKGDFEDLSIYNEQTYILEKYSLEKREIIKNKLIKIKSIYNNFEKINNNINISYYLGITENIFLWDILNKKESLKKTEIIFEDAQIFFENDLEKANFLKYLVIPKNLKIEEAIDKFKEYLNELEEIRNSFFGYFFKKEWLVNLNRNFKKTFNFFNLKDPVKNKKKLIAVFDLFEFIYSKVLNDENKEIIFRDVIELLIQDNNKEKVKYYDLAKENLLNLSKEIFWRQYLLNIKISEIEKNILLVDFVNVSNNLIDDFWNVKEMNLKINQSNQFLKIEDLSVEIDYLNKLNNGFEKLLEIKDDVNFLKDFQQKNKQLSKNISLNVNIEKLNNLNCVLCDYWDKFILDYLNFKEIEQKLYNQFNKLPKDKFSTTIKEIENLTTAQMTYFLDKRIIEYIENHAWQVATLKNIVSKKQKFPKGLFENMKKAFPCILAWIRDYAEFIPLEKDLFDLIIIDEASQVSIAQALPAFIRGKKIIVLWDDKQFSNVKSGHASNVTNQQYKTRVKDVFIKERLRKENDDFGWLNKVDNFDIKYSVLKFARSIRNYECQLKKHFRCYPEIISYSDKYFYENNLQCMKIRGVAIEEVIKFDVIEHDGKLDYSKNTNELEVDFIIEKLKEFKQKNFKKSIWIITPHPNQVSLLWDKINNLLEKDWLFDSVRKLKIMTFDSCQWEERDYIFYSMVATKEKDQLNRIFPVNFKSVKSQEDWNVKSQRLNVWFSRAKECVHFILSKPIEEFQGEIRNTLIHYKNELENGKNKIIGETDPNSPMEDEIQKYFYTTKFYKDNQDKIEFIPQFDLWKYLKQLYKNYIHPKYKVDFLLIFKEQKIVIEYDWFKEHFENLEEVNKYNYKYYMKEDDIYRQKVLEGYWYKFLRINKFNIGENPVETLDLRLNNLLKKKSKIY